MAADAQHGPFGAVAAESPPAPVAGAAREVDLADDPPSQQRRPVGALDDTHELVAGDSSKPVVPAAELEVGVADSREGDPNERLARACHGSRDLANARSTAAENESLHEPMLSGSRRRPPARIPTR